MRADPKTRATPRRGGSCGKRRTMEVQGTRGGGGGHWCALLADQGFQGAPSGGELAEAGGLRLKGEV